MFKYASSGIQAYNVKARPDVVVMVFRIDCKRYRPAVSAKLGLERPRLSGAAIRCYEE
jgi:hypothetical protein